MLPLRALQLRPWPRSTAVAARLDPTKLIEEENSPHYDVRSFYQARIGDVLGHRYQLATKLGHGSSSTVWLAQDLAQSGITMTLPSCITAKPYIGGSG